jgi:MoaA/NifB/PqqE/SkfB family radical SAM enzyme
LDSRLRKMILTKLQDTYKRYQTVHSDTISALPVVILMPHSACNCRCVMCDIWKDNKNLKQLTLEDISGLLDSLRKFGTRQVVMSGGEALLNPNFFKLCALLKGEGLKISLLTTGLSVKNHADQLLLNVDDLIVSLDGDEETHDAIRNVPNAFKKMKEGVMHIKTLNPYYRITGRTVIHRLNFRKWQEIINAAQDMELDQISFLPADVSSHAFNRQTAWSEPKQHEILIHGRELSELQEMIYSIITGNKLSFTNHFIAESVLKIQNIYHYYAAFYGINPFPYKKCNAPWVSAVIEADGSVRPCFFHDVMGNIRDASLDDILNSTKAKQFRKHLDVNADNTCVKCVCSLNLSPFATLA